MFLGDGMGKECPGRVWWTLDFRIQNYSPQENKAIGFLDRVPQRGELLRERILKSIKGLYQLFSRIEIHICGELLETESRITPKDLEVRVTSTHTKQEDLLVLQPDQEASVCKVHLVEQLKWCCSKPPAPVLTNRS